MLSRIERGNCSFFNPPDTNGGDFYVPNFAPPELPGACFHNGGARGYIEKIGSNAYKVVHPISEEEREKGVPGQVNGEGRMFYKGDHPVLKELMNLHNSRQNLRKLTVGSKVGLKNHRR